MNALWRSRWFDAVGAATYDFAVQRERLARPLGRLVWGTDTRLIYRAMQAIAEVPDGSAILDVPCGGGVAFRALRPGRKVRYVAADLSPGMLRRARAEARRRGLEGAIEVMEADVVSLPFDDASFDLCVCFNSLHCFAEPDAALIEIARCLGPGGRFVGDSAVRGAGSRFDRLIALYRRQGVFGEVGTAGEVERWLADAGLTPRRLERSGAILHIVAER